MPTNRIIEVVAAVIFDAQGRIFATQRGYGEWKDWWEFPGGKIEEGEEPLACASREITEETGFVAKNIECVGAVMATPGYCSEVITLFIGTGLEHGDANPDLNEYISTVKMPLKEAVRMADDQKIEDSKTLVLLYKAARRLGI